MPQFDCLRDHSFIPKFSKESVILDCGGLYGEFSSQFAHKYPYGRIIVIEANPHLVPKIKYNLKNLENIEVINAMIGSEDENSKQFMINSENPETNSMYEDFARVKDFEDGKFKLFPIEEKPFVQTISLKGIYQRYNLEKIDLVKMDIEGSEWDIFEHFDQEDYEKIEQITVEFHDFFNPEYRKRSEKCIDKLKGFGYKFIHKPGHWGYGTPYVDCVFYK